MLKLSSNVSDVFPKVLKLSSEVSECKPLAGGGCSYEYRPAEWVEAAATAGARPPLHAVADPAWRSVLSRAWVADPLHRQGLAADWG